MQIPSIPLPLIANTLPQDVAAKAVPNVQAAQPLVQNPVTPAPKGEKSHHSRSNKEQGERRNSDAAKDKPGAGDSDSSEGDRGGSVNISV